MAKEDRHVCMNCIHFDPGDSYGLDEKTGYCNIWKKFVKVDHTCERFEMKGKGGLLSEFLSAIGEDVDADVGDEESELEMPEHKDTIYDHLPDNLHGSFP